MSSSTFGQKWPTVQRGLSAIAELLVINSVILSRLLAMSLNRII